MSKPDWNFWKLLKIKPWQGCALSLDLDPDKIELDPYAWLAESAGGKIFDSKSFPSKEIETEFDKRLRIVKSNISKFESVDIIMGDPDECTIETPDFAKGALILGIELPLEFAELANNVSKPLTGPTPQQNDSRDHISEKLSFLNQAADKFWRYADKNDPSSQPKNSEVISWLEKKGYSTTLAEKAATIIRPDWAATGRKPE